MSLKLCINNRYFIIGTLVAAILILIGTVYVGYSSSSKSKYSMGSYFNATIGEISDKYPVYLTPPSWAFAIWSVIYFWQFSWLVFCLVYTIVINTDSLPIHPAVYLLFLISCFLNVGWVISWISDCISTSLALIILLYIDLMAAFYLSNLCYLEDVFVFDTKSENCKVRRWVKLVRQYLISNGLDFYAGWVLLASVINLGVVLEYSLEYESDAAAGICLYVLGMFIFMIFDFRHCCFRYKFYYAVGLPLALIFGFSSIISGYRSGIAENSAGFFTLFLFTLVLLVFIYLIGSIILHCMPKLNILNRFYKKSSSDEADHSLIADDIAQ